MCGVLYTNDPCVTGERFLRALDMMRHRGPDAPPGYLAHGAKKLGHNRLKVLDLDDRCSQPFFSKNGRYAAAYNGEVYNFKELAKKYGIRQRTSCDTEVLVELYALIGPRMLPEINGMFAIIIIDVVTGSVFAARDRLGIKPLYCSNGASTTIASEIAPVVALTGRSSFDEVGLRQYRKLRAFFNGRTAYKGISMFPAGHYILDGKVERYWSLPERAEAQPSDGELLGLIKSAISYRCISDVPVGAYLSGGLDSTMVASLSNIRHTWTVGFDDSNEFDWARLASNALGTAHTQVTIKRDEFVSIAKGIIKERKEPLSVPNEVLLYRMTQEVKKENTVVLSGEGADELFFGYDRVFRWAAKGKWDLREFSALYSYGSAEDLEIVEDALSPFLGRKDALSITSSFFQVAHLHGLLRRLDSSTMLCSVEARVPFVDHRLVERLSGAPFTYRMEDGVSKAPLKRIARGIVPDEIIDRKKVGFPVPLATLPLGVECQGTPMDAWLEFNLRELTGADEKERNPETGTGGL